MIKMYLVSAACTVGILTGGTSTTAMAESIVRVPSCLVGQWRSIGLPEPLDVGRADVVLTGGAGIEVSIDPNGHTEVDFSNMSPVAFTVTLGDAKVSGTFRYTGRATGTMVPTVRADGPMTHHGAAGRWAPTGDVMRTMHVAMELDRPAGTGDDRPMTSYPLRTVDKDPFLDTGRYWCLGDTLIVNPDDKGLPTLLHRSGNGPAHKPALPPATLGRAG